MRLHEKESISRRIFYQKPSTKVSVKRKWWNKKKRTSMSHGRSKQIKDQGRNHHDLFTFECLSWQTLDPYLRFDWRPPHTFPEYFIGYVQLRKQIYMTLNWKVLTHLLPRLLQLSAHPDSSLKHVGTPQTLLKDWWKLRPRTFFLAFSFSNYQVSSPNGKIPVKINDLSFFFLRTYVIRVCIYIYILYYVYLRKIIAVPECL